MTLNILGLNANSFKMVKATDFKFDRRLLMDKTEIMTLAFFVLIQYRRVTDRRIDGRTLRSLLPTLA